MKYQAIQFYNGEYLDEEGNEIPYDLEHITSEDLYIDFIEDTDDDFELQLLRNGGKLHK